MAVQPRDEKGRTRMRNIGVPELLIVLVIVLLLFGARKLPDLARSLGQSAKELRKGMDGGVDEGVPTDEGSKDPTA